MKIVYESSVEAFKQSEWFTRGGHFMSSSALKDYCSSTFIGGTLEKNQDLRKGILACTGISKEYLLNPFLVHEASVAQRMGWASDRETSRAEDIDYSLVGLFNANRPLLFGEGGEKAFYRLQLDDESILAWNSEGRTTPVE